MNTSADDPVLFSFGEGAEIYAANSQPGTSKGIVNSSHPSDDEDFRDLFSPNDEVEELRRMTDLVCGKNHEEEVGSISDYDEDDGDFTYVLALNEAMSELVDDLIVKIENALASNKAKQRALYDYRNRLRSDQQMRKIPNSMFLPPYFKDSNNMCPPMNKEMKQKLQMRLHDPLVKQELPWKMNDFKALREGVRECLIDNRIVPLVARREMVKEKVKNANASTSRTELAEWVEEIDKLDRKIAFEKNLPDESIFIGDYSNVDWAKISILKFPDTKTLRNPASLRLRWLNEQCPAINKEPWRKLEVQQLHKLANEGFVTWNLVADQLGTKRTAWQCFEKFQEDVVMQETQRKWTCDEDERLTNLVKSLKVGHSIPWEKVAYHMPGRTREQVKARFTRTLREDVRHGRWTDDEDLLLMCAVGRHGPNDWEKVGRGVPGRTAHQCRERWRTVLDRTNLAQEWTMEEDEKLLYGISMFGQGKYAKVASILEGRNARACRNRYRSLLTAKMRAAASELKDIRAAQVNNGFKVSSLKRRNRVYRKFNEIMDGEDPHGIQFCQRIKLIDNNLGASQRKIPENIMRVVTAGVEEITKRYRSGHTEVNVEKFFNNGFHDNRINDEMMGKLILLAEDNATFKRPKKIFRPLDTDDAAKNGAAYKLSDSEWANIDFKDDVDEEERRQQLMEGLCQLVRKHDQCAAIREIEKNTCEEAEYRVNSAVRQKMKRQVLATMEAEADGKQAPLVGVKRCFPPTLGTLNAIELLKRQRAQLLTLAKPVFSDSDTPQASQVAALHRIEEGLGIQLLSDDKFLRLREEARVLFLRPLELLHTVETNEQRAKRLQRDFEECEREFSVEIQQAKKDAMQKKKNYEKYTKYINRKKLGLAGTPFTAEDLNETLTAEERESTPPARHRMPTAKEHLPGGEVYRPPRAVDTIDETINDVIESVCGIRPIDKRRKNRNKQGERLRKAQQEIITEEQLEEILKTGNDQDDVHDMMDSAIEQVELELQNMDAATPREIPEEDSPAGIEPREGVPEETSSDPTQEEEEEESSPSQESPLANESLVVEKERPDPSADPALDSPPAKRRREENSNSLED